MDDIEEWRKVPGWEAYSVSSLGRVRRDVSGRGARVGGILRPWRHNSTGHLSVCLCRNGERRNMLVHRLMMLAFNGECPEGQEVRHLDGNPSNNALKNLEYGTQSENALDAHRYGGRTPNQRLTLAQVSEIRQRLASGEAQRSIARAFGVSDTTISNIKRGLTWAHRLDQEGEAA